ncbi:hypothetical protein [Companilactobacillus mishanensis]|uniref:Uncharacterized protein n=1 Tax=Companilactobacillus mishanensis TaxID=2486008 RepID=A0A5P0ZJU4_9LACO|nr:hypothetical protein [Companilactobacillus mishanensis]MQS53318.1 hypothetical protein [Companilactobacillus mishanensis]
MITILSLIFLISVFLIWFYIKKQPNKNRRNIAIIIGIFTGIFIAILSPDEKTSTNENNITSSKNISSENDKNQTTAINKKQESIKSSKKIKQHNKTKPKKSNKRNSQQKDKPTNNAEMLEGYAQSFGLKDSETIQRLVGSAYSSTVIDNNMAFGWWTPYGSLIRIDDSQSQITYVYKSDKHSSTGLGELLYQGHTIIQKAPSKYRTYGPTG